MAMYRRYTNVAPHSHLAESPLSASTVPNPTGTPKHVERQVREDKLSETAPASRTVSSSHAFEAVTIKDHAPALPLAPAPANSATRTSWTTSRTRSEASPVLFALGTSPASSPLDDQVTSFPSTASESAPTRTTTASPVQIESARTTGMIIGSVLGGLAVLLMISLAAFYATWRRRRGRQVNQADREKEPAQQRSNEAASEAGKSIEERKRPTESPLTLPLQGATAPRTLRSQPIIVDAISPITPILPHLSRWTSEKADIPSPSGHPAVDIPPHLRHHLVFASTPYGHDDDVSEDGYDDDDDGRPGPHEDVRVSPCSSSSPSPSPRPPGLPAPAAAENTAFSGFLFFDSPSSRSSTGRPSTRDSSAPRTALSMPPRRRHTRAGGQGRGGGGGGGGATGSRRGSGSSVCGGGFDGGGGGGCGEASSAGPPSPPPPMPVRNAARSKSLHHVESSAVWI